MDSLPSEQNPSPVAATWNWPSAGPSTSLEDDSDPTHVNRWGTLNNVKWFNTKVAYSKDDGFSLVHRPDNPNQVPSPSRNQAKRSWREAQTPSSSRPNSGSSVGSFKSASSQQSATVLSTSDLETKGLLIIPYDLILCEDYLNDYAMLDVSFGHVMAWMDAVGFPSPKFKFMAFLCLAWIQYCAEATGIKFGVQNPWWEYVKWLPGMPGDDRSENSPAPLATPTTWTEAELKCLKGTSLETLILPKIESLKKTLTALQAFAANRPELIWVHQITFPLWARFDACYLSRFLETPESGTCMVPCLDMANHSYNPTAHYIQDTKNGDLVLMKYEDNLPDGAEITINYAPANGAAESLMKYGFIDHFITYNDQLSIALLEGELPIMQLNSTRLKVAAFQRAGISVRLSIKQNSEGECICDCPFALFLSMGEEDGLVVEHGPTPQECGKILYKGEDISELLLVHLNNILDNHPNTRDIQQRVVTLLIQRINEAIDEIVYTPTPPPDVMNVNIAKAMRLRDLEHGSLLAGKKQLMKELSRLDSFRTRIQTS